MKLKFKQQQYQIDATNAIARVFAGQSKGLRKDLIGRKEVDSGLFGIKTISDEIFSNKKIEISDSEILHNLQNIQKEQGLKVSKKLEGYNFTVEMETGTGKTYVYTRTMFELNKQYGWNKFIIMVPSIAIREGVHKSLQITADHFQEIYHKKIRFSIYDTKNKSNIVNIKSFANTSNIEVIIMNYQAFGRKGKESLKMFQKLDVIQSEKPIDILKRANPILIIDEPQRFGETAENMLAEFNPLFVMRFSATHKKEFNKVYRLDAIDAFNQKLVKKIKVKGIETKEDGGTHGFLFVDRINISKDAYPTATIEFEVKQKTGIKKVLKTIKESENLFISSGELAQYKDGYVIKEINGLTNTVSFLNGLVLSVGQTVGDSGQEYVRRIQIRETIKSHIEKERILFKKGIKVLSLFFIDEVSKYRVYDSEGNQMKSEYEEIFEEEYLNIISQHNLFDTEYQSYLKKHSVEKVHNGYFSIDKKGRSVNSKESRNQDGSDDVDAYDLIMKHKEKLLSFDEPTRFIFSHSALREGWDNPNIFQICTLRHTEATISKRQEIGRGLRISVNEHGERMDYGVLESEFFDINNLTVIANESYDNFAKDLQKEILESLSDRPTKLEVSVFKDRQLKNKEGKIFVFDEATSMKLIMTFSMSGYIDENFKITDKLISDIENNIIQVPEDLKEFKDELSEVLVKIHTTNTFKSTENEKDSNLPTELSVNENFAKKEFQDLWNKIKVQTIYEVDFDSDELIDKSVRAIDTELQVRKVNVHITEGEQNEELSEQSIKEGKVLSGTRSQVEKTTSILGSVTYDLISDISRDAHITRKTVVSILQKIKLDKFSQFKVNPEHFIQEVSRIINEQKAVTLIDNITYHKTEQVYSDDIFTINNFQGSLKENVLEVKKHIYNYIKTDSKTERDFASELEKGDILVYAKLPHGFKIPTPVGNYNPDWAIVFDTPKAKYVYFVAETKGSMSTMQLKKSEELKIEYAKKHFESLSESHIKYGVISNYEDLMQKVL